VGGTKKAEWIEVPRLRQGFRPQKETASRYPPVGVGGGVIRKRDRERIIESRKGLGMKNKGGLVSGGTRSMGSHRGGRAPLGKGGKGQKKASGEEGEGGREGEWVKKKVQENVRAPDGFNHMDRKRKPNTPKGGKKFRAKEQTRGGISKGSSQTS